MKLYPNLKWIYLPLLALITFSCAEKELKYTPYVDPFIGTGGEGWSEGRCFPGATVPYGMVQLSPEVRDDWWTGYYRYDQPTIKGFSHTHLSGAGISEGADITLAPTTGEVLFTPGDVKTPESGYRSRYSKETEQARPGYYTVVLDDYGIRAELTATTRTGMHRYTFPETTEANIIVDLRYGVAGDWVVDSWIKILDDRTIGGFRRTNRWADDQFQYFAAQFSEPFDSVAVISDSIIDWNLRDAQGHNIQAAIRYNTTERPEIIAKVALSSVSLEGALLNLNKENPGWDFDKISHMAEAQWEKELSKVEIEGDEEYKKTFYTALYHTMMGPTVYSDVDGSHRGHDRQVHEVENRDYYTLFSLWDTYRTLHPLMTILQPERTAEVINSFLDIYEQGGMLPIWEVYACETYCMMGYHAVSVIADAYVKGIRGFDEKKALEACRSIAEQQDLSLNYYTELGYIPSNRTRWSVSKSLEYAYDDYCIAMFAKEMGDAETYDLYIKRAQSYKNVFNPETGFFMGRNSDGKWKPNFNPRGWSDDYCEAGAYQYKFYVPHDVHTLIDLFGSRETFTAALDTLFARGEYQHDNEPSHHMPFLYNYAGAPWKTQERVHRILTEKYNNTPEGLCGNDDVGQMSAWYVMSALGIYPVCPGTPEYALTAPLFDRATIRVGKRKTFVIEAKNRGKGNKYIQSVTLNGKPYHKSYLTHADIMKGGVISFELSDTPNTEWAIRVEDCPPSRISETATAMPVVVVENNDVIGPKRISLECVTPGSDIYYTLDGSDPTTASPRYEKPIDITETAVVKAQGTASGQSNSLVSNTTVRIRKSEYPKIIENLPVTKHHELTADGGSLNLIDGLRGTLEAYSGYWVYFEGDNQLDVTVDLGSYDAIGWISVGFLHMPNFNIFLPKKVEYLVSEDGRTFTSVGEYSYTLDPSKDVQARVQRYNNELVYTKARYVRIKAEKTGACPPWHSPWFPSNMCVDEIVIL